MEIGRHPVEPRKKPPKISVPELADEEQPLAGVSVEVCDPVLREVLREVLHSIQPEPRQT